MVEIARLAESCLKILSERGRLSTAIPGFVARVPQCDLAVAIANAIEEKSILVAEAGTGTGKTFAYLLPCLLSQKKAIISTATKTLQDQLYQKDLPTLVKALGLSARVQNLKGRSNYLCHYRVELHASEGQFQSAQCAHEIAHIRSRLSQMQHGDRSELPEINEDSPVWYYATSTGDNCLGMECPNHDACFLLKARKRALEADIVVINHHLFFADSLLKEEGFGELLPGADVIIFDEAHQLAETAINFNENRIGTRQFRDLMDEFIKEWPTVDLENHPLKTLKQKADQLMDELYCKLGAEDRISWEEIKYNKSFMTVWNEWFDLKDELINCVNGLSLTEFPNLRRYKERLMDISHTLIDFKQKAPDKICWVERYKHTLIFHATPYDIAEMFRDFMKRQISSYVFTSATLTVANSFNCFCTTLGLDGAKTLLLPSPFDYQRQAVLYLPRGLPDPKNATYYDVLIARVTPLITALGGRCFFLFTSHKALKHVAQMMDDNINYPLLVQGTEAKPILLERFRQFGNAILLGTATFWEGVDVKGEALSCVIIDKLPFSSPKDPIVQGRMAYLKKKGLSGFDELTLPNAAIALKQGVGRLIRDNSDKGVLIIADPRLTSRKYGERILASLPKIPKTRDEQKVLQFIRELELDYEFVSA